MFSKYKIIIKGGGDLATAVAHKLFKVGFSVIITELENPKMVRRTVSFANCIYEKEWTVEGVTSLWIKEIGEIEDALMDGKIPVIVDPNCYIRKQIKPFAVIDAILAKKNTGTRRQDAPLVIGLGPGFTAGEDVHVVIETNRGHDLGRIIYKGQAEKNTGIPGIVKGVSIDRVLRAPWEGVVENLREIGDIVEIDDVICSIGSKQVRSRISGVVRGLIHNGTKVCANEKIGDIDPRGYIDYCYTISDKGRTIASGVLEAILIELGKREIT